VRFAFAALIGTVLVAVVLALAYGNRSLKNLSELGADKNTALALSISNAARVPLQHLLDLPPDLASAELRNSAAAEELQSALDSLTRDLSVVKVKVYNRPGITVFSTDPDQVGKSAGSNPGFITAMVGGTISEIVRRDTLNPFDQIVERRDLIQTYLPVHGDGGKVIGVFEVYSDVTPLLARVASTQRGIVAGVAGILGLFYVLLVWLYWRIDKRLIKEEAATQSYLEEIEAANSTLEQRVWQRTTELERLRKFLQTALDGVPDPAIVIDKNYRVTSMNQAARDAFDADRKKPEELCCYSVMHGRDTPCDDPAYPCTLTSGAPYKIIESRIDATGRPQEIEIRTIPLRDSDGATSGAIAVMHDMNEREQIAYKLRQAKERAETSSQVKSEFVAMMSHEIRTPMNAVLGMTDLLRLTELTRKQQGYIQTIQSSGNMLLSLVDNILDFSRLGAGALKLQTREFRVIDLLERVMEITGYQAYMKGLELAGFLDANMQLRVSGDKNRLRQILVNLVSNAVRYSERGEIIVGVSVRSESKKTTELLFSVTDHGIGMTDEVKQKIFTPFTRVVEQAAGKQQGTGLGLAICKQLVEYMGGEIGVDSQPGEGTRIWFTVPVESRAPAKSDLSCRVPGLRGQRVLTVCENPSVARIICSYTSAWDMSCDIAASADEALNLLRAGALNGQAYGLAIIDNTAGAVDGLNLARQIRTTDDVKALPVILLTPISRPLEPGSISSIGRILCVNKPVLPSELHLAKELRRCRRKRRE
jgi:signal transduction histidine kinase/CheY-like chemotaxis protein